ncbi:hypothetical protein PtA15_2A237 [Puccinia triticina]|uniref:Uncharacterized protein n=1 Tax=Puccinia triticina TaxID=208348 RepID=A0ABY7CB73_9BASI|nr:uncharacterized protein PtA15_2A237 [Puccinia triticina]WAQ81924.1 hypothetical protein PtA15_2A237 [Puccinia triticina]WAR52806.1 hypothetical protein PtB15_2B234 [Puccinia triticina]
MARPEPWLTPSQPAAEYCWLPRAGDRSRRGVGPALMSAVQTSNLPAWLRVVAEEDRLRVEPNQRQPRRSAVAMRKLPCSLSHAAGLDSGHYYYTHHFQDSLQWMNSQGGVASLLSVSSASDSIHLLSDHHPVQPTRAQQSATCLVQSAWNLFDSRIVTSHSPSPPPPLLQLAIPQPRLARLMTRVLCLLKTL